VLTGAASGSEQARAFRLWACGLLFLLAVPGAPARAQTAERDILDAVLERSQASACPGSGVSYGDPALDAAERVLRLGIPRPWTVPVMLSLYESATAGWLERMRQTRKSGLNQMWEGSDEERLLIDHLVAILAASRDPRAAVSLFRELGFPDFPGRSRTVLGLYEYFVSDPSYRQLPRRDRPIFSTNVLPLMQDDAQTWWDMNRGEIERRAAVFTTPEVGRCPGCRLDEADARALLARLVERLRQRRPTLRVSFKGQATPRFVQSYVVAGPVSGTLGGSAGVQRDSAASAEIVLSVPTSLLSEPALSLRGLIVSPGFRTVSIDVPDTSAQPEIPVAFTPLPSRTRAGTVTFTNGTVPRTFVIGVDISIEGAAGSSSVLAGMGSTLLQVTEAVVGADGAFTLVLPDIAEDPLLMSPDLTVTFRFRPRDAAFVLTPNEVPVGRAADGVLTLTASPRPPQTGDQRPQPSR